jgi:carboxyl-terminal processing protease
MPIAVEIASHFIEKWKLIVSAKYKWYEDENYYSEWFGEFEDMNIVVLIDGMTASAWEIIAMALQEQAWAKLLWTTSFGKWTIQTLDEFADGDSIKYTIWKWFAPSEKNINKIWVDPDIVVEFDVDNYISNNYDNQLEEAKSVFK